MLPAGDHEIQVVKSKADKSRNQKDMIVVQFQVVEGPHAGAIIFNNFVISPESPNALGFFFQHMQILGLGADFFAQNPTMEQVAQALLMSRAKITISVGEFKNKPKTDVDDIQTSRFGANPPVTQVPQVGVPQFPQTPQVPQTPPAPTAQVPAQGAYSVPTAQIPAPQANGPQAAPQGVPVAPAAPAAPAAPSTPQETAQAPAVPEQPSAAPQFSPPDGLPF